MLRQLGDMYLYLGPSASLTVSPDDRDPVDDADRGELERRHVRLGRHVRGHAGLEP